MSMLGSLRRSGCIHGGLLLLPGCTSSWGLLPEHISRDIVSVYICCSRGFTSISLVLSILRYNPSHGERVSLYVGGGLSPLLLKLV
ncbi:hypothetical protein LINGRAHAP2_LOCUS7892 [Linum grandiflorum]